MKKLTLKTLSGVRVKAGKYEASVKVGTGKNYRQGYQRFPLDTPLEEIAQWQEDERKRLREELNRPAAGTLAQDAEKFLASIPDDPGTNPPDKRRSGFRVALAPWVAKFGDRPRKSLTKDDCRDLFDDLTPKHYAASTLNKIRQALISLYTDRDGEDAACPASKIKRFKEPKPEARAIDKSEADLAIASMMDSTSKARLGLLLWTGARPIEVARLTREQIVLDAVQPYIHFVSGKDGDDRVVPLTARGVEYARLFIQTDAFGMFSNSSLGSCLRRAWFRTQAPPELSGEARAAWRKAKAAQLRQERASGRGKQRITPYVLRHTCFTELRKAGADLADVAALAGHKSPQTTKRYAPVVQAKLVAAMNRIDAPAPAGDSPAPESRAVEPLVAAADSMN